MRRVKAFDRAVSGGLAMLIGWGALLLGSSACWADGAGSDKAKPVIPLHAVPFDLKDVRLGPGPFRHAMELDQKYLLALDVDRLLHAFRLNAGLPSSAKPLGGWEEPKIEVRGHFVGHYLSACALMYASTGDARFKVKGEQVVAGMAECQKKLGSGYLSAFPESFIDRVEKGQRVWAPWYTLHKILAGLLDMNEYCGSAQALDVARKFGDWVETRSSRLSDEQMQAMLRNEHGGINEGLANLYARTGDARYLKLADRFNHRAVLDPAAQGRDTLTGLHANTQIPKFIGTARQYELTGKDWYKQASAFFWNTVVHERSYVIGGHSDGEMFTPKESLSRAFGPSTTETCNTYNMLKLTRHLFEWDPRAAYADYYERALYNHILSSQDPETGMMCYYVPLRSGSHKVYNGFDDAFWCCTGTGVENHAKYGDSIYFHDGDQTLFVNLFIASELDWTAKGLKVTQATAYPDEQRTKLAFTCAKPTQLAVKLRHPAWATEGFAIAINGKAAGVASKPGEFATIERTWSTGDTVEVAMPFRLRTEGFADNPRRLAFLHGPLVLAAPIDARRPVPAIVTEPSRLLASLRPYPIPTAKPSTFVGAPEVFRVPGESSGERVILYPFYKMHGGRPYVVYWDVFTAEQWTSKEEEYAAEQARRRELDRRTVDRVNPGEEQNERDHQLAGEKTGAGDFGEHKWRHAEDGGFFRYTVKVLPGQPQALSVTYWGSDGGRRLFDILVDGKKLATERLENNRPGQIYDQPYALPAELTKGKDHVTLTFQAHPRSTAGGVFGIRVLTPALAAAAATAGDWKLVWGDEFDTPGLPDPKKWGYEVGFIRNGEKQYYTRDRKENARVEDGRLIIEARKERWPSGRPAGRNGGRRGPDHADYTSASLTTQGKAAWTYGRIEMKAKLPKGRGTWPAFWMLGTNIGQAGWPACGEIDIMEFVGYDPGVVHANIHTKKYNHSINTGKGDHLKLPDASEAFHVYAVEWDREHMDFFVDESKYFSFRNEGSGVEAWPFDRDQYLILNLAIGGGWGGRKGIDDGIFPQKYEIDYVRVYQKPVSRP